MASLVRTSAGAKLAVSAGVPTPYTAAGFQALVFTDIGEVSNLGEFGEEYALVTFNPLGSRGTVKRKGSYNSGSIALEVGSAVTDAGQILMKTAKSSDASYAFRVTTQSGSIYNFTAQVMGWKLNIGTVDQITTATATIEIDNDILDSLLIA